ncbi:MAG: hypothetical protein GY761_08225 [Hyphomicrobiales bacterium]|nr:hypothetical protein [Hyphomicrobiales bacterium]
MAYSVCEQKARKAGLTSANYKFACKANSNSPEVTVCVKGQTINVNQALALCKSGDFDGANECTSSNACDDWDGV